MFVYEVSGCGFESSCSHLKNIDINEVVVFNKASFSKKGFKYLISYKDAKIRFLCIFLPKMRSYGREFDETKYVSFLIKKSCNGEINTNFHNNEIPREGSQFICLSLFLNDSVFKTGKN